MKIGRILVVTAIILVLGSTGFTFWFYNRDPLSSLPPPQHELQVRETSFLPRNHRTIKHVILHNNLLGDIGIAISLPDPLPDKNLPILIVLGGLGTGENNIRYLPDAGDNVIVGYDWPMPVLFYSGFAILKQIPEVYHNIMTIPAQVASAVGWVTAQPWADREHVSLLGFSLGALAAPAIQDMAANDGQNIRWTILAYGGAPYGALIAANPYIKPLWLRGILAPMIDLLLAPLEPTRHLAHLSGRFLILEGRNDSLIPELARIHLRTAVPFPKTVIAFDGDHMGVGQDKLALLQEIITASKAWLIGQGAINPF